MSTSEEEYEATFRAFLSPKEGGGASAVNAYAEAEGGYIDCGLRITDDEGHSIWIGETCSLADADVDAYLERLETLGTAIALAGDFAIKAQRWRDEHRAEAKP